MNRLLANGCKAPPHDVAYHTLGSFRATSRATAHLDDGLRGCTYCSAMR